MLITKLLATNGITKPFYIILFLSLSMFKFTNCQDILSGQDNSIEGGEIDQEEIRDPFSYIDACFEEDDSLYYRFCLNNIIIL